MATTEQKKQMLLESFDILKDLWHSKSIVIRKTIVGVAACDLPTAMEMWLYIIEKNRTALSDESENLMDNIIWKMEEELEIEDIAKAVFAKPTLVEYLFKENYYIGSYVSHLLSYLMISGDESHFLSVLQLLSSNPNLNSQTCEKRIGSIVSDIVSSINDKRKIKKTIKDILYNFITQISDKQERAEAMVALLDLD